MYIVHLIRWTNNQTNTQITMSQSLFSVSSISLTGEEEEAFFWSRIGLQQSSIRKTTIIYNKRIWPHYFLMLAYFFISLNLMHEQLIHETNRYGNNNDPATAGPSSAGPAEPGPTLSSCTMVNYTTLFRCVFHIHHTWLYLIRQMFLLKFISHILHVL